MLKQLNQRVTSIPVRVSLFILAILTLALIYLFQRINFLQVLCNFLDVSLSGTHPYVFFVVNKSLRLIANDLACFMIIIAIFQERKYLKVAWYVFLVELLIILPFYFIIKLSVEGESEISSPLLSQIHRIIVNPTLMILLIIGFFYQKFNHPTKRA